MEIRRDDGFIIELKPNSRLVLGRKLGFHPHDPTISRSHLSIESQETDNSTDSNGGGYKISFLVIGKNPVCVLQNRTGEIKIFRKDDSGEMVYDDMFCALSKEPVWFKLMKIGDGGRMEYNCFSDLVGGSPGGFDHVSFDVSAIDRVKEFGFTEMGKEFDMYPKRMIPAIDKWNWFLSCGSGKRKAEGVSEDEWVGDLEGEKDEGKGIEVRKMGYSTRSTRRIKNSTKHNKYDKNSDEDAMDDDQDSLGGFIADELVSEEGVSDEDDEEDEFSERDDSD